MLMSMRRTNQIVVGVILASVLLFVVTFPIWGMGAAMFLDADRAVISSQPSPDGRRIAQIERLVVGSVPSVVVTVRPSWMPDWYLPACAAASHYRDTKVAIAWGSPGSLTIRSNARSKSWKVGIAPFHNRPCSNLSIAVIDG